jgi:hypothetical protein
MNVGGSWHYQILCADQVVCSMLGVGERVASGEYGAVASRFVVRPTSAGLNNRLERVAAM